jgi:diadenosine tetraphosphate (Ap4A) HIT family hydrolase
MYSTLDWNYYDPTAARSNAECSTGGKASELIAETDNFFVLAGLGSFVPGYTLIVAKPRLWEGSPKLTSLAEAPSRACDEFHWLLRSMKGAVETVFDAEVIGFEHGIPRGVSGPDRNCACMEVAHFHIMPIPRPSTFEQDISRHNASLLLDEQHFRANNDSTSSPDVASMIEAKLDNLLALRLGAWRSDVTARHLDSQSSAECLAPPFPRNAELFAERGVPYIYISSPARDYLFPSNVLSDFGPQTPGVERLRRLAEGHEGFRELGNLGSQFGRELAAMLWGMQTNGETPVWNWRYPENMGIRNMNATVQRIAPFVMSMSDDSEARRHGFSSYARNADCTSITRSRLHRPSAVAAP